MDAYEQALAYWRRREIHTAAELAAELDAYGVLFAYHSGKLENDQITYHDTREIFDHDGVTAYTGDLRTLFEIRNAKSAYEFALASYGERRRMDEAFLLRLQKLLTRNTYDSRRWELGERPGAYKKHDYVTGREEVGALAENTPEEVRELLAELSEAENHILTAAAYFHAKLENIHPFADGNGRTGRLAMNYFLISHGRPPIIVHEEDRKTYYGALEAWDREQVLKPLIAFLRDQTAKTWRRRMNHERKESAFFTEA